jgi:hypothetical protein
METTMNSKADRYRDNVKRHMDGGSKGTIVMVAIFVLSAILSALFFWRHSTGVFAGIPWIFATVLGLLVGLIPSELAFFGWKDIQKKKEDMTGPQASASDAGMWPINAEEARIGAVLEGMDAELELSLDAATGRRRPGVRYPAGRDCRPCRPAGRDCRPRCQSNSTHAPQPTAHPAPGQGQGNGPAAKPLGRDAQNPTPRP